MSAAKLIKRISFNLLRILTIGVSLYALTFLLTDFLGNPNFKAKIAKMPVLWTFHLVGGAIGLSVSTFSISEHFRKKNLALHKVLGKMYVISILIAAIGGFVLAFDSDGKLVSAFGFGLLAVIWFYATLKAFLEVKKGNIVSHKIWMYRSFALTLAAVWLRLEIPLLFMTTNSPFSEIYPTVSWLSWVPSIIFTEWFIVDKFRRKNTVNHIHSEEKRALNEIDNH